MTSAHSLQLLINYYVTDETNIEKFYTFSFESKDHAGEHEDSDGDNDQDETKIFVSLMKSVDKTLETNEVSHHLEDSENTHDTNKTNDFSCFSNDFQVLETLQQQSNVERNYRNKVNQIHFVKEKLSFTRRQRESQQIFDGEEGNCYLINNLCDS